MLASNPAQEFTDPEESQSSNPVLLGNFPENDPAHSILHYVDRKNPSGPMPSTPQNDSLYNNWEQAVQYYISPPPPTIIDPLSPFYQYYFDTNNPIPPILPPLF